MSERFRLDGEADPYPYTPICKQCRRLRSLASGTCDAFPGGIPADILAGDDAHTTPRQGDNGLTFSPRPVHAVTTE